MIITPHGAKLRQFRKCKSKMLPLMHQRPQRCGTWDRDAIIAASSHPVHAVAAARGGLKKFYTFNFGSTGPKPSKMSVQLRNVYIPMLNWLYRVHWM